MSNVLIPSENPRVHFICEVAAGIHLVQQDFTYFYYQHLILPPNQLLQMLIFQLLHLMFSGFICEVAAGIHLF